MAGWTGVGKDEINWKGKISQTELTPVNAGDLVTKQYVDSVAGTFDANIIVVLDGAVATLDGNVLILQ